MPINIPVHEKYSTNSRGLAQFLKDLCRRAIDGSLNPTVINVQINVTGNDIFVVTAGKGLVVTTPDGNHTYRINVANNGSLQAVQLT